MAYGYKTKNIQYVSRESSELGKLAEQIAVLTFQIILLHFWEVRKQIHYRKVRNTVWKLIYKEAVGMTDEDLIAFLEPITQRTAANLAQQIRE